MRHAQGLVTDALRCPRFRGGCCISQVLKNRDCALILLLPEAIAPTPAIHQKPAKTGAA
jgi:hypothetical protein